MVDFLNILILIINNVLKEIGKVIFNEWVFINVLDVILLFFLLKLWSIGGCKIWLSNLGSFLFIEGILSFVNKFWRRKV